MPAADHGYFRIFKDSRREWRWILRSKNNKDVAASCKGYMDRSSCVESIQVLRQYADAGIDTVGIRLLPDSRR